MPTRATMYCLRCGYALDGLRDNKCPECGRPFYPQSPRTYRTTQHRRILPRHPRILPRRRTLLALFLGGLPILIFAAGGYIFCVRLGFRFFPGSNIAPVPFLVVLWPLFVLMGLLVGVLIYKAIRR